MMATETARIARSRTGSKFETLMWFFTRVTGIVFLLMGAFNLVYANLTGGAARLDVGAQMRWAFFPISFHITDSAPDPAIFSNAFCQIWSFLLFVLAATHGYNGLRVILGDYVRRPLALAWLRALLFVIWLALIGAAIFLVFVYAAQYPNVQSLPERSAVLICCIVLT
jgi:succinate dehydrogenase hydrophobic anchor subunit